MAAQAERTLIASRTSKFPFRFRYCVAFIRNGIFLKSLCDRHLNRLSAEREKFRSKIYEVGGYLAVIQGLFDLSLTLANADPLATCCFR